jgi:hypothetical protein
MKFRKLRSTWSVMWGLLAVLLCVLWVRSCWRFDQIIRKTSTFNYYFAVTSARGQVSFGGCNDAILSTIVKEDWVYCGFAMDGVSNKSGTPIPVFPIDISDRAILLWPHYKSPFVAGPFGSTSYELGVPYWLPVILACAFAATAWLPWANRFSVRTLLIATTFVAGVLGLAVWSIELIRK